MRGLSLGSARARMHDLRSAFALRDFAIYQTGNIISTIGFWMQRVAIGWVTWQMTGSATWLGIVAFAELFPSILTGLAGGVLADRKSSVMVMLVGQMAVGMVSVGLAVCHLAGVLSPWLIVAFMVIIGALSGLILPARLAMASHLLPPALLPAGLAVNSAGFNLSRFIGPALAAGMLVVTSAGMVFAITAALYFAFALSLAIIRHSPPQSGPRRPAATVSMRQVVSDLALSPLVLAAILLQLLQGVALRPAAELFPAFAETVFNRGEAGLGLLNAALGIGAVFGAIAFNAGHDGRSALMHVVRGTLVFAATLAAFALTPWFGLALGVLVVQGWMMTSTNIAAMSHVQLHTPRDRLGRVLSLYSLVFRVGPALGAFLFGFGADLTSLAAAGVGFAVLGVLGAGAVWLWLIRDTDPDG